MPDRDGPLWSRLRTNPRVVDREGAVRRLADLDVRSDTEIRKLLTVPRVRALLAGIADHSPYLWQLIEADPGRLGRVLAEDPLVRLDTVVSSLTGNTDETEADVMRRLRRVKQEVALVVAFADLGGVWPLETVMRSLSRAADALVRAALVYLLRKAATAGKLRLPDRDLAEIGCGIAILGLGKLGGLELNFSSDVDLVVIFDAGSPSLVTPEEAATLFVRMVRDLVRLLQQPTADGYVARVDLRLRPDPSATAVAIGVGAAFLYYETFGQNWERAAMIKARPVAGDLVLAQTFIDGLSPFIWRKYFDYAAIADIHAMKRQIHAVKGGGEIAVAGHNIKLGRGGIREIEFFVQTQQLIFGGKRPALRGSRTLPMLRELRRDGWIGDHAVADLTRAYDFLRRTEHRLQMIADEQTHKLPQAPEALERFARFCGFASAERFAVVLTRHLSAVVFHYALLFEHAPGLDDSVGSLVFTGVTDDPETIETLAKLGYKAPGTIVGMVREWHSGKRSGVQSARARETLTDLVPKLLVTFSQAFDPDGAVAAFDKALERLPAASELFAILTSNAMLRSLFGDILGSAPRLAEAVVLRPHLLDAAIGPAPVALDEDVMEARASGILAGARSTEAFLDAVRDFQHEEHFLIGVRLLSGEIDPDDAGRAYAALAVAVIRVILRHLVVAFVEDHGRIRGASVAVLAMGKLGSLEMTATSDLDLVLLYDFDPGNAQSDGARPLHATRYFTRLTQRLVSYLTVATRRGGLYEVDMRLRPSGGQGPLATKISAFVPYQRLEAQTWERMALSRGRVVAGDASLGIRLAVEVALILREPPPATLARDVAQMRALLEREKPPRNEWDFKLLSGGLIDIEFVAQFLALNNASRFPNILTPSTQGILRRAGTCGAIEPAIGDRLIVAHRLYTNTTQIMRLALTEDRMPDDAGEAVRQRLAAATGLPDFARLKGSLAESRQAVCDIFRSILPMA